MHQRLLGESVLLNLKFLTQRFKKMNIHIQIKKKDKLQVILEPNPYLLTAEMGLKESQRGAEMPKRSRKKTSKSK